MQADLIAEIRELRLELKVAGVIHQHLRDGLTSANAQLAASQEDNVKLTRALEVKGREAGEFAGNWMRTLQRSNQLNKELRAANRRLREAERHADDLDELLIQHSQALTLYKDAARQGCTVDELIDWAQGAEGNGRD